MAGSARAFVIAFFAWLWILVFCFRHGQDLPEDYLNTIIIVLTGGALYNASLFMRMSPQCMSVAGS